MPSVVRYDAAGTVPTRNDTIVSSSFMASALPSFKSSLSLFK